MGSGRRVCSSRTSGVHLRPPLSPLSSFAAAGAGVAAGVAAGVPPAPPRSLKAFWVSGVASWSVELHAGVGRERLLERFLGARLVILAAAAHDADVHPGFGDHGRGCIFSAGVDRAGQHALGFVEVGRQIVLIDGLVDLLRGSVVSRVLRERRKREERNQCQAEQSERQSAIHVVLQNGGSPGGDRGGAKLRAESWPVARAPAKTNPERPF